MGRTQPFLLFGLIAVLVISGCRNAGLTEDLFNGLLDDADPTVIHLQVKKRPTGSIKVGEEFHLIIQLSKLRAQTEEMELTSGAMTVAAGTLTPHRVGDLPDRLPVAAGPDWLWATSVKYRCLSPGLSQLNYRVDLRQPVPASMSASGRVTRTITHNLGSVRCIDGGLPPATPIPDVGIIPTKTLIQARYGEFEGRIWKVPNTEEVAVGETINVHVEIENFWVITPLQRSDGTFPPWSVRGSVEARDFALSPARYAAPEPPESVDPFETWTHLPFPFTCTTEGVAKIVHTGQTTWPLPRSASLDSREFRLSLDAFLCKAAESREAGPSSPAEEEPEGD